MKLGCSIDIIVIKNPKKIYPSSRPKPSQIKDTNIMIRLSFTLDYHKTRNLSTKFIGKTLSYTIDSLNRSEYNNPNYRIL